MVSSSFDPMLGKVIAWGADREAARTALVDALDRTGILGLTTNTGFVRALAAGAEFRDATIDTAWLDHATVEAPDDEVALLAAAWVDAVLHSPRFAERPGDPFATDGWRVAGDPARTLVALETPGGRRELRVDVPGHRVDDVVVSEHRLADHTAVLSLDGRRETAYVNATAHKVEVAHHGQRHSFERPDAFADHGPAAGDGTLLAPMPGTVLDVLVTVGQQVDAGETLGAMEAMKMELALTAPFAGTVTEVNVAAGAAGRRSARSSSSSSEERAPWLRPSDGLPERVTIYEVGPRDGLQNEKAIVADRGQGRVRTPPGRRRPAGRRGHQLRAPEVGPPARGRRRPDDDARRGRAATTPSWSPTSAASTARSSSACGTSRSSAAPPRPSRRRTSTAASTSSSRCSSRPWPGPATRGSTSAPTSPCASATRGRARCRSTRWSSVGKRLFDLGASELSLGDTIGVGTAGHVKAWSTPSSTPGMRTDQLAMHFHDTYGQALANAFSALQEGITTFDASAGGLGGCPYAKSRDRQPRHRGPRLDAHRPRHRARGRPRRRSSRPACGWPNGSGAPVPSAVVRALAESEPMSRVVYLHIGRPQDGDDLPAGPADAQPVVAGGPRGDDPDQEPLRRRRPLPLPRGPRPARAGLGRHARATRRARGRRWSSAYAAPAAP